MNCKNTPEGRIVRQKYADILPLSRPEPTKPRMTIQFLYDMTSYVYANSAENSERRRFNRVKNPSTDNINQQTYQHRANAINHDHDTKCPCRFISSYVHEKIQDTSGRPQQDTLQESALQFDL